MVVIVNRFFNNKDIEQLVKENSEKVAERKGNPSLTEKNTASKSGNTEYQSMSDIAKANRSKKEFKPKNYTPVDNEQPLNSDSISSVAHMLDHSKNDD
jgi:hypothetical protein